MCIRDSASGRGCRLLRGVCGIARANCIRLALASQRHLPWLPSLPRRLVSKEADLVARVRTARAAVTVDSVRLEWDNLVKVQARHSAMHTMHAALSAGLCVAGGAASTPRQSGTFHRFISTHGAGRSGKNTFAADVDEMTIREWRKRLQQAFLR